MTTNRTDKHKLFQMLDNIGRRDKQMVEEMNGWMGDGMTIEKRIVLADARACDALAAIAILANYIVEREMS